MYSRDGTDFRATGFGLIFFGPVAGLEEMAQEVSAAVRDLECNHVTLHVIEYFGEPGSAGRFSIHPIAALPTGETSSHGYTVSDEQLLAIATEARANSYNLSFQLLAYPYYDAGEWVSEYQGWAGGQNPDFRLRPGFVEGAHDDGLRAFFDRRLPFFVEYQDVIDTIYLGAEWQYEFSMGGSTTRAVYDSFIDDFRAAGYESGISHAAMTGDWDSQWVFDRLTDPLVCGMPFADMDTIGTTFYSRLLFTASEPFPGSSVLLDRARDMMDRLFIPLHENSDKPVDIADFYCLPIDGCLYDNPTDLGNAVRKDINIEEFLQYHGTWLTALAEASRSGQSGAPWLGVTVGLYQPVRLADAWLDAPLESHAAWVNANYPSNADYRRLLAAFFGDHPLVGYLVVHEGE